MLSPLFYIRRRRGRLARVCCEFKGRNAMAMGYHVAMVSDCMATKSSGDHLHALKWFHLVFGGVVKSERALALLAPGGSA